MPERPLEGILVADFSRVLAGPLATMTLADLGARVIKVERPGLGDDTRHWGPPFSATGTTYFDSVNRNKESLCLDLTDPHDLDLALELAIRADVVVENFKPGGMNKLGLDYEKLATRNPGLIYASISGFGDREGAELPGYDFIVQALGGLMSITGEAEHDPTKVGVALVDVLTAKDTTIGILAALTARQHSGLGAHLKMNLLSSLQGGLANQVQAFLGAGTVPARMGNEHPSIVPYQLLDAGDGPLAVACGNDSQFAKLSSVLGSPELAADPRFASNAARVAHRAELIPLLETALAGAPAAHWQSQLSAAGVPAGKVGGIDDGLAYAESLGLNPTINVLDRDGKVVGRQVRHPITWEPEFSVKRDAPPRLGQDSDAIISWLAKSSHTSSTIQKAGQTP